MERYQVEAHNTATASTNKIHDDVVARNLGFRGGLVPGVDVFAYLTHVPAAHWGRAWLERGTISARFATPVYDGDVATVEGTEIAAGDGDGERMGLTATDPTGAVCATAEAGLPQVAETAPALDDFPVGPLPDPRPEASPDAFAALPDGVLGAVEAGFRADRGSDYLAQIRETLPLYAAEGVAHPGWLLRMANSVLVGNVLLGPWIHVGSDMRLFSAVTDGERISARSRLTGVTERKGHRFVEIDVLYVADDRRPVARVAHTAIYEPRGVRADLSD